MCEPTEFKCPDVEKCIPKDFVCDDVVDCLPGGEDEKNCSKYL